jgi:lipid A ethanolaminephosphotransferase
MFSVLPRAQFDVDEADRYANLLDALVDAGIDVEWRDNNAGCKGVCARVRTISYADRPDARLCPAKHCYDEVMLGGLADRLRELRRDTVFVFHQIGSHGPAYFERYSAAAERFSPACRSNQLQSCTAREIINAYDNTLLSTDAFLAAQIALLQHNAEHIDAALLYVSDHGESLGEQGVFLHGMPYAFAPRTQKEVPMLLWTSSGFRERVGLGLGCMKEHVHEALSHDNLYHTVLGAAEVRNLAYDQRLDVLARCRRGQGRAAT